MFHSIEFVVYIGFENKGWYIVKSLKMQVLFSILIMMICLFAGNALAEDNIVNIGKITLTNGNVEILHINQTEWTKVAINEKVNVGDRIKVADMSKLEICYEDGNILRVGANSELEMALETIKLYNGQTWVRVVKVGQKFEVVTPTFVAGVRGTVFAVTAKKAGDKKLAGGVKVWKGAVATTVSATKKSDLVTEGCEIKVDENNNLSQIASFDTNVANEFSESSWQSYDTNTAYNRYITLLFAGISPLEAKTNPVVKKQLEERKKLPEVIEAFNTYKSLNDEKALENVISE